MDSETEKNLQSRIKQLEKELDRLKKAVKNKKFGLVWMEIPEEFEEKAKNAMPVLKEVPEKAVISKDGKPTHILIEGDNYHALTCLNYTHRGKIDVIYIDPPYNTGDDGFKYKDKRIVQRYPDGALVPKDHPLRHSYWLSFMHKRLSLASELLKDSGAIFISINEEELFNLKVLCDEIFGPQNYLTCFTVKVRHEDRILKGDKDFHEVVEYLLLYRKSGRFKTIKRIQENTSNEDYRFTVVETGTPQTIDFGGIQAQLFKPNEYEIREVVPGEKNLKSINIRGSIRSGNSSGRFYVKYIEPLRDNAGYLYKVPDIGNDGLGFRYFLAPSGRRKNGDYFQGVPINRASEKEVPFPNYMDFEIDFNNVGYEGGIHFREGKKPINFIKHIIKLGTLNAEAITLDFFAGSGSTAEAVLQINEEENVRRQVILISNNENSIMEEVCHPRITNVVRGYSKRNTLVPGLGNSFKYYRTDFIGKNNVVNATDADKVELAHQAGDLLAIAENTLYKVKENDFWQLYENAERYTVVYFREELDHFEKFVAMVEKLKRPVTVYVFSWGDDEFSDEFEHIEGARVKPIPLPILEIYKSIYNAG